MVTTSCSRDTFSMGCRSSGDSLSEFVLEGGDEGEEVESFIGAVFSLGDSAALIYFPAKPFRWFEMSHQTCFSVSGKVFSPPVDRRASDLGLDPMMADEPVSHFHF